MSAAPQHKVLIVGDSGVGKTTYLKRYQTGDFEKNHIPTEIASVYPIEIKNSNTIFNCWDIPSNYTTENFNNADAAIVMFDVTCDDSFNNVDKWIQIIKKECGDIPIIILANKIDIKLECLDAFKSDYVLLYTSSRSNYNYEKPFNCIDAWIDALN
jgi:GTP-binding nuclear protein Ran